jgi:diguanylate cyclase (GGDEF)-like protein/PAS domain S-box-containing protein
MTKNDNQAGAAADKLRRDAEARLNAGHTGGETEEALRDIDLRRLVHELQVHQIELEMQNAALRQTQEDLEAARDQYVDLYDFAPVGYLTLATDGRIIGINLTGATLLGETRNGILNRPFSAFVAQASQASWHQDFQQALRASWQQTIELVLSRADGSEFDAQLDYLPMPAEAAPMQLRIALTDISERKEAQLKLERLAHFDTLTGLPNRELLADRMHQSMAQTERHGLNLAVVYLDLDGFKEINDRHGHDAGDQLLAALAKRMKQTLREGDTLARLGGDEFVAVLPELADIEASEPMLVRLLAAAAEPVRDGTRSLQVSASAGISFFPQAVTVDADQLLRQADHAMYQAKLAGKNRYQMFDAEQDRNLRGHHESLQRIRVPLAAREFVLHYQPKVNMRTGQVVGVEALIRWQHPQSGLLPPAKFLPVIENHPLAIELGDWVIDEALKQMETWQAAGLSLPVSVNVGANQLQQADFVERLRALLAAHPAVAPENLELEVLESRALADLIQIAAVIDACHELGVRFALDDFGAAYASLTYLKRLSVSQLKIDQSLVRNMLEDPDDLAILEGVLGLTTAFSREAIAEGVESREHGELLLQLGCELAQGYFIAHPMPAAQLPGWAATWQTDARWLGVTALRGDDLPILYAGVEHRAWIVALEHALKHEIGPASMPDEHQCRFGAWLDGEGLAGHADQADQADQADFMHLVALHQQVHRLAAELLGLQAQGQAARALARLDELHVLRDSLLDTLHARLQAGAGRQNRRQGRIEKGASVRQRTD